jgi:hypothetical protein
VIIVAAPLLRFGDENFDGSEQACGDVMLDYGDGDERIAENPSHHSAIDAEFRQPTAAKSHLQMRPQWFQTHAFERRISLGHLVDPLLSPA